MEIRGLLTIASQVTKNIVQRIRQEVNVVLRCRLWCLALVLFTPKSHNLQIDDALIAATSITMDIELITYNVSDFRFIHKIKLYQFS